MYTVTLQDIMRSMSTISVLEKPEKSLDHMEKLKVISLEPFRYIYVYLSISTIDFSTCEKQRTLLITSPCQCVSILIWRVVLSPR